MARAGCNVPHPEAPDNAEVVDEPRHITVTNGPATPDLA
jgi:hypothetical protein